MLAARLFRLVSSSVSGIVLTLGAANSAEVALAADARRPIEVQPVQEIDFWQPDQVKPFVEEALKAPDDKPADEQVFYASGVGHFDDFIPSGDLSKTAPDGRSHRLTYHNGRITLLECVGDGGIDAHQTIRYNRRGAPRASGFYAADGKVHWYKYATYDQFGRISMLYTFDEQFEIRHFEEFNYRGEAVDIRRRDRDRNLQMETIYEDGAVYLVQNDVKRKVNELDRKKMIRGPIKFGLKPYYPGFETVAEARDGAK